MQIMSAPAMIRKPQARFGETYGDLPIGGVGHNPSASGVTNWKSPISGKVFPLLVGLRPTQEALLQQVADNTAALKTSMDNLASTMQSRFRNL